MILLAALLAGVAAPASGLPLAERVPDIATRYCVDMVSGAVAVPTSGKEAPGLGRYGLTPGLPNAAARSLGPAGTSLIARATLASGEASDGAFVVALGGTAGTTCRIIVYRAPLDRLFVMGIVDAMKQPGRGWRTLPIPAQSPGLLRLSMIKRGPAEKPFIATVTAPEQDGPVAMIVNVAAVPSTVALPQGF